MKMQRTTVWAILLLPLGSSGCQSYAPSRVSAMSTYDICELQALQNPNLTEEARRLMRSELERRKETCAPHQAAIRAQQDKDLYDQMYGGQSP